MSALYEITYACTDEDWLSWRIECHDFHEAATAAFQRLHMADVDAAHKLHKARLLRVERLPEGARWATG